MAASLAALDVTEHRWLGWHDGACHRVADGVGVEQVTRLLDEVRPDTIITFGPDGMTGHADHRAVSRWVTAAWASAPQARLLYATVTPDFHATWAAVNDDLGVWAEQTNPPCTAPTELAVEVTCDEPLLDQKLAALRAHASQTAALEDRLGMATFRRWWQVEAFVAAPRPGPRPSNPVHERTGASRAHR
jgi:LmbE family N-acetylglucosaminyl deacetylase